MHKYVFTYCDGKKCIAQNYNVKNTVGIKTSWKVLKLWWRSSALFVELSCIGYFRNIRKQSLYHLYTACFRHATCACVFCSEPSPSLVTLVSLAQIACFIQLTLINVCDMYLANWQKLPTVWIMFNCMISCNLPVRFDLEFVYMMCTNMNSE